ncbi:hypothetical protein A4R29_05390 [Mesorhizobium ciceri biovar biserrulae]|nr:hypothetical protein A4R29_05390 [Mesorhizobium ciceri biovar biserrulae]
MTELVALHHTAKEDKSNEGIKFSAIAAALELEAQTGNADAARLLASRAHSPWASARQVCTQRSARGVAARL